MAESNIGSANAATAALIACLLTTADVAKTLNCCVHTVRRYQKRRQLPAVVFNRRTVRYRPEDVRRFIELATVGNRHEEGR